MFNKSKKYDPPSKAKVTHNEKEYEKNPTEAITDHTPFFKDPFFGKERNQIIMNAISVIGNFEISNEKNEETGEFVLILSSPHNNTDKVKFYFDEFGQLNSLSENLFEQKSMQRTSSHFDIKPLLRKDNVLYPTKKKIPFWKKSEIVFGSVVAGVVAGVIALFTVKAIYDHTK